MKEPNNPIVQDIKEAISMARLISEGKSTLDIESIVGFTEMCTVDWKPKYTDKEIINILAIEEKLHKLLSDFYVYATNGEVCNHEVINDFLNIQDV